MCDVSVYKDRAEQMDTATTLVLVRHAQALGNVAGAYVMLGGSTNLPLTEHGFTQASVLGAELLREPPPTVIYSSPLDRALQTAAPIAARLGQPVRLEPALREVLCGAVEGWPVREVETCYPREWARNASHDDPSFRWPGGESYQEFRERILDGITRIVARHPNERVMAVTHAGVISQLIGWTLGENPARWDLYRPRNASVSELLWHTSHADVLRFDDCVAATLCS